MSSLNLHPVLLEVLLRYWQQEGSSGSFKLGPHVVPFSVDDVAAITGIRNEGISVQIENKKPTCAWAKRHFNQADKVDQRTIKAAMEDILSMSPTRERIEDASRLYIVFLFATVLFPQTNGLCSGMLCDMVENLIDIGRFNWAQAIHSFLVYYMGLTSVYARTRASGGQARGGNLCGATWILQV